MRKTKQKEILSKELNNMDSFFNAEELYQKVIKKDKNIGIATIYRFLKNQNIHTYQCNRKTIYSTNKRNHSHFICTKCGKIQHIDIGKMDFIPKVPGKICHIQIDISGTCKGCQ